MKSHNKISFYPQEFTKKWIGEPSLKDFEILTSSKFGKHVISKTNFKIDELVFVFSGQLLTKRTLRSLQISDNLHIHDPYFMGYIAHSCDPNCTVNIETLSFISRKDISKGDIISMDYKETETNLFRSFTCSCGSTNCRGIIS
tara:strand:+ start:762 stop:1190 length:429 start_codon:yes stop_codon:yes gene_type:complete